MQRHGISRLPLGGEGVQPKKAPFKDYPLGYLHLDLAEVQTAAGKRYLFVAIDRTSKLAFAELHPQATQPRLSPSTFCGGSWSRFRTKYINY